jgi:hypothetical protein
LRSKKQRAHPTTSASVLYPAKAAVHNADTESVQESGVSADDSGGVIEILLSIVIFCVAVGGVSYGFFRKGGRPGVLRDPDENVPFKFSIPSDQPDELARLGFSKL